MRLQARFHEPLNGAERAPTFEPEFLHNRLHANPLSGVRAEQAENLEARVAGTLCGRRPTSVVLRLQLSDQGQCSLR